MLPPSAGHESAIPVGGAGRARDLGRAECRNVALRMGPRCSDSGCRSAPFTTGYRWTRPDTREHPRVVNAGQRTVVLLKDGAPGSV